MFSFDWFSLYPLEMTFKVCPLGPISILWSVNKECSLDLEVLLLTKIGLQKESLRPQYWFFTEVAINLFFIKNKKQPKKVPIS